MRGPAPRSPGRGAWAWLCLVALWLATGCSAPSPTPGADPGPEGEVPELVVWHAYRGAEQAALASLASRFQAEAPQAGLGALRVRLVAIPYDAFPNKVTVAVPRGNGPDVFIFAHDRVGDWAAAGLLEPYDLRPQVTALRAVHGAMAVPRVRWFEGNFEAYEAWRREQLGEEADRPHRITYKRLVRN